MCSKNITQQQIQIINEYKYLYTILFLINEENNIRIVSYLYETYYVYKIKVPTNTNEINIIYNI